MPNLFMCTVSDPVHSSKVQVRCVSLPVRSVDLPKDLRYSVGPEPLAHLLAFRRSHQCYLVDGVGSCASVLEHTQYPQVVPLSALC